MYSPEVINKISPLRKLSIANQAQSLTNSNYSKEFLQCFKQNLKELDSIIDLNLSKIKTTDTSQKASNSLKRNHHPDSSSFVIQEEDKQITQEDDDEDYVDELAVDEDDSDDSPDFQV